MLTILSVLLALDFIGTAQATGYRAPPATLRAQFERAAAFGEFTVASATTVILEDGFPVTHVVVRPVAGRAVGIDGSATLILPGGVVEGRFDKGVPDGFQVSVGETVFLQLEAAVGLPGYYNLAGSLDLGLLRRVQTPYGARAVTPSGRMVTDAPCDAALSFAVESRTQQAPDAYEEEEPSVVVYPENYVVVSEDPSAYAADWEDLVLGMNACGRRQ